MIRFEVNVSEAGDELAHSVSLVGTMAAWRLGHMQFTEDKARRRMVGLCAAGHAVFVVRLGGLE